MKKQQTVIEMDLFSPSDFGEEMQEKELVKTVQQTEEAAEFSAQMNDKSPQVDQQQTASDETENTVMSSGIAQLFLRLSHSQFRSRFYLNQKDKDIIAAKGLPTIREHARQIIAKRLAPAVIPNDGKQTPMRHGTSPVFIAQHATACCCRGCLEKWHNIPKGRALTPAEQAYVVEVIMHWIESKI